MSELPEPGQRVLAKPALGDGWSKEFVTTVDSVDETCPLPHYDGAVVFVNDSDGVIPVRASNVEVVDDE